MTTFASRVQTHEELRASYVHPDIATRRANGVRSGRPLSDMELADLASLKLEGTEGATHVGDLSSYASKLLGVRRPSAYELEQISDAEDRRPQPWAGGYDAEVATRQGRTFVGYDATDHVYGRGSY